MNFIIKGQEGISLRTIAAYFGDVTGLQYEKNRKIHGVHLRNNEFDIPSDSDHFTVLSCVQQQQQQTTTRSDPTSQRVQDICTQFLHKRAAKTGPTSSGDECKKMRTTTKDEDTNPTLQPGKKNNQIKTTDFKKSKKVIKKYHVGILYRSSPSARYATVSKQFGGEKILFQTDNTENLSVNDVINKAKAAFINRTSTMTYFQNSKVQFGRFDHDLQNFGDTEEKKASLFDYLVANSCEKFTLYLRVTAGESETKINDESFSDSSDDSMVKTYDNLIENNRNYENITNDIENEVKSLIHEEKTAESKENDEDNNDAVKNLMHEEKTAENGENKNYSVSKKLYQEKRQRLVNSKHYSQQKKSDYASIDIQYYETRESQYGSHNMGFSWKSKQSLYDKHHEIHDLEGVGDFPKYEDFHPGKFGYRMASLCKNKTLLVDVILDQNLNEKVLYPECTKDIKPHTILYQLTELHGLSEGRRGLAVIATCNASCRPVFKWYCGDKLLLEGERLNWINIDPAATKETGTYHCKIFCNKNPKINLKQETIIDIDDTEKKIWALIDDNFTIEDCCITDNSSAESNELISKKSNDNLANYVEMPESINSSGKYVHDFFVGVIPELDAELLDKSKNLIYTHSADKIYDGYFDGTPVAAQEIISVQDIRKDLCRVRHPGLIDIMGYCLKIGSCDIIMEKFDGQSLSEIQDNPRWANVFFLDTLDKNGIGYDLCKAVKFLHGQRIIHGNINPTTVFHSVAGQTKLWGFDFNHLERNRVIRSYLDRYQAPELHTQLPKRHTASSDTYSVALTLTDLYANYIYAPIDPYNLPDTEKVPRTIRNEMANCLSQQEDLRLLIALLNKYRELQTI